MINYSKTELVRAVAESCAVSKSQVEEILTVTFAVIREETAGGKVVNIPGFGKFVEKVRKPRTGRNMLTGEPIEIGERRALSFKPSKAKAA